MPFITLDYPIKLFDNYALFPTEGELLTIYVDKTRYKGYLWDATETAFNYIGVLDPNTITSADDANELEKGILEIATQAETNAGTDDTRAITPKKLAAFSGLGGLTPFTPEKTVILGSNSGAWVVRSLGASYANKILEIRISKSNSTLAIVGARAVGSVFDLSFSLGRGNCYFQVVADGAGDIEIKSNKLTALFWIVGAK